MAFFEGVTLSNLLESNGLLISDDTRLHNLLYLTVSLGWLSLGVDLLMTIIKHYCCKLVTEDEDDDDDEWKVNNKFWEESLFFEALKYKSVGKKILKGLGRCCKLFCCCNFYCCKCCK